VVPADARLTEREQVELLDALEPANRDALLHALTLLRDGTVLSNERVNAIARAHRADGWVMLCGLGYAPPWGRLPPQQRVALRLAVAVWADVLECLECDP
jgi:hypothetical protein